MEQETLQREYRASIRMNIIFIVSIFFLVMFFIVSWLELKIYKVTKTCESFSSYEDAKKAISDYPKIDAERDGKPCESKFPRESKVDQNPYIYSLIKKR